jgi:hypothetical protein
MFNPLFTASWDKVLWLCCVQVPRCCWRQSYAKIGAINKLFGAIAKPASMHQPSEVVSFSYWSIKPWFHTKRKLSAVLIIPSSWGSQLGGWHRYHLAFQHLNLGCNVCLYAKHGFG